MNILEDLNGSADLKKLKISQLSALAVDLRSQILSVTRKNGGHLSSNLGMVETTIALHYCFDLPKDKIVFDVGHQCYAHKLLSDRKQSFESLRSWGGISGFPDIEESEYDAFSTGHAGTSISAALGLCYARDTLGQDHTVIAVVGDGSLSNGLNLEALNASNQKPNNFIVILNDNGMSISKNKNGFYKLISKSTTKRGYVKGKRAVKRIFGNSFVTRFLIRCKDFLKRVFNKNNYFEKIGFKYVGVIDGNNVKELTNILSRVKNIAKEKAVLLHVRTTKGKGYDKAEENSSTYHGVSKNFEQTTSGFGLTLGQTLSAEMDKDERIVAITAGMKDGTGLFQVEKTHPDRFYDVGIAEEYAVTLAAGMAKGGLKPVVGIYSTFTQRAYDQIVHDVCLQNLPVVLCLDRAGLNGEDGKTHQGLFDISYLSHLPNLTVFAPADDNDLAETIKYALSLNSPVAIRYPKKGEGRFATQEFGTGEWERLTEGKDVTVLAVGPRMIKLALNLNQACENKLSVVCVKRVNPLDQKFLDGLVGTVITLEENAIKGGFGQAVKCYLADKNQKAKVFGFGIKDEFIPHGSVEEQLAYCGLTVDNIKKIVFNS